MVGHYVIGGFGSLYLNIWVEAELPYIYQTKSLSFWGSFGFLGHLTLLIEVDKAWSFGRLVIWCFGLLKH